MSKSVSTPNDLCELRKSVASSAIRRFSLASARLRKQAPMPLSGFVILVEQIDNGKNVRLFGTAAERAGLSIGDEIIGVNEMKIDDISYNDVIKHLQYCIRKKVIQLKIRRKALDIMAETKPALFSSINNTRLFTDAYMVSINEDHIKEVTKRLKKEYPDIHIYNMEFMATEKEQNGIDENKFQRSSLRRPPESFEMKEKLKKEQENNFLRCSLRKSKKLQSLAKCVEPSAGANGKKVTSFANPVAENDEEDKNSTNIKSVENDNNNKDVDWKEQLILDDVIISVERIASKLTSIDADKADVDIFRDFFSAPPIQAAIEQTVKASSQTCGTTSSGIGSDPGDASSRGSSPIHEQASRRKSDISDEIVKDEKDEQRLVKIYKSEDSYLGATVRNENNRIIVGRVIKGGIVDKENLFQEGDELVELNGVSLKGKQINEICEIMRNLSGEVTFLVAPNLNSIDNNEKPRSVPNQVQHLRALFDYDPEDDVYVPCKELAMKFQRGDILHVLNTSDENWWQAYREGEDISHSLAGLIPSASFRQQVVLYVEELERENDLRKKECKKKIKKKTDVPKAADEANLPNLLGYSDFLTYEEVILQLPRSSHRRPLVLCGAEGVGCLKLRDRLLENDRITLACPVPYTSRPPKDNEIDGIHYHFITRQKFHEEAKTGKFVEFGEFQKHWYGTAKQDIIRVIERGKTCVITLKPESLGAIRSPDVQPYIVFIAAPSLLALKKQRQSEGTFSNKDDDLKNILTQSKKIEQKYGHLFDGIIVNMDMEKSLNELKQIMQKILVEPSWVPATWSTL